MSQGGFAWLTIMPLDVIKSTLQANRKDKNQLVEFVSSIYKKSGALGFYKGLWPTVLRGFLVNSVILTVYSFTLDFLNK